MKSRPATRGRKPGRPLSFDPGAAVEPAMRLFWRHGYEATTLAELTRAMGVSPPSIYAAYGDKKGLFRAAVRRYAGEPLTALATIADATTARDAARLLIEGSVVAFTGEDTPPGCMLAGAAVAVSSEADDIRAELAGIRATTEDALRSRIVAGVEAGEVPAGTDPVPLAAYVMTVIQGLATLARDGATRSKLMQVADLALAVWPREDAAP